jgi:Tfp pilus assembly protein PilF
MEGGDAMVRASLKWFGLGAPVLGVALLGGCLHLEPTPTAAHPMPLESESTPKLTAAQTADVKIAFARTLEKRGALDQAQTAYLEALKLDRNRADACSRLGVLYDQQCKFDEGNVWHQKAIAAQPKNADFRCNLGYSLYLQGKWMDAEENFRQCLALSPQHARAHNNLGMVLARTDRCEEALAEFRRAGCTEADAQANLAYALTLEGRWLEAQSSYEQALAADPNSITSRSGLQELERLMAKVKTASLGPEQNPR